MLARTRPESLRRALGTEDTALLIVPLRGEKIVLPRSLTLLQRLIVDLALEPSELQRSDRQFPVFLRELFLLATQECLQTPSDRTLRRFAQALRQVLRMERDVFYTEAC